jgi:hypothetical protein
VYTLGTPNMPWKHLYLGSNSLTIGNCVLSADEKFMKIDNINVKNKLNASVIYEHDLMLKCLELELKKNQTQNKNQNQNQNQNQNESRIEKLELLLRMMELKQMQENNTTSSYICKCSKQTIDEICMEIEICKRMLQRTRTSYDLINDTVNITVSNQWQKIMIDINESNTANKMDLYMEIKFIQYGTLSVRMFANDKYFTMVNGQVSYNETSDVTNIMTIHIPVYMIEDLNTDIIYLEMKSSESMNIEISKIQIVKSV